MDTTPLEEKMHPGEQENLQVSESKEPSPIVEEEVHSGEQENLQVSESKEPSPIVEEVVHSGEQVNVHISESKDPPPIVEGEVQSGEQGNVHISELKDPPPIVEEEIHSGEHGNVQMSESKEPSPVVEEQKHSGEQENVQKSKTKEPSLMVIEEMHFGEEGSVQISESKEPSPIVAEQKHSGEQRNVQKSELEKPSQILEERSPTVGMVFESEEDLHTYYQRYAYQVGFGFKRISTKSGSNGRVKYFSLACSRGGKFVSVARSSATLRPSIKTGCLQKINVVVEASGRCTLSCVYPDHNHPLSPKQARYQKIPKRKHEEKDCTNDNSARVRQLRLCAGDAEALSNYFARMKRRNSNFDHVVDMDDEGRVRNIFWADARSRAAYESFADVVSFDSTYLTNKYNMPLVTFAGVNHHGQSVLFGCGLLSNQDTETYTWLFRSWLECMNGRHPKAVITDQHDAIQAAVAQVFPHSHHRLCLWHIMKKIPQKMGGLSEYKFKAIFESIVYDSIESNEFDENWSRMIQEYNLEGNDLLSSLFQDRAHWIPAYVKRTFWAGLGMSSTQGSETMKKSFFDDYVNSKTTLKEFVEQYDDALKSKMEKECKADFESVDPIYALITDYYFERQFQDAYTNTIFKLFQDELRGLLYCNSMLDRVDGALSVFNVSDVLKEKDGNSNKRVAYTVTFNEAGCDIQCSCHLFEYKGVVCRHMVKVLIENDVSEVPPRYILTRWRKDVKRRHFYVKNCYGDCQNSERGVRFDNLCANFFEAADIASDSLDAYEALMSFIDEAKFNLKNEERRHLSRGIELRYHRTNSSKGRLQSNKKESTAEQTAKRRKKKKEMQNPEASSVNESIGQINFGQLSQRYDEQGINLSFDSGAVSMSISGINHNH